MACRWRVRRLREDLAGEWAEFVKSEGLSPGGILRGVWAVLLGRYTGESEVVFGTGSLATVSGNEAVMESSVTMFPVRIGIADDVPASRWLRELDRSVEESFRHAGCSESDLRRWSGMPGDLPLYESAVILSDGPVCLESPGLPGPLEVVEACGASIPLALVASVHAPSEFALAYDTSRFAGDAIERMLLHVETLLLGFLRSREEPLGTLSMLTETEEHHLLVEWNRTATDHRDERPIHELFQAQVERSRHATALDCHGERWSYAELDARANQVGNHLRKRGVGPEVLVGICLARSLETVVGILGILKAGGAYVPLDPAYPRERLAFMLEDTRAPILLTLGHLRERLPDRGQEVLCLDSDWPEIARESIADPRGGARCDNLAYVIYTSGSTGKPKGVAIEHRSASALIQWAGDVFSRDELAGVLFSTSICFDLSVFEMFVPLSWGGTIIMAESVLEFPRLPSKSGVTLVNTVPSAMTEALELGCLPDSVRTVNLAGEKLSVELVGRIYEKTSVTRVYDLFGPSEDTTYSTFALRSADGPYTIGRPIANTRVYLLDDRMRPVPIGVTGEMYLGGSGLARGYLNRPELTAERFVADPFSDDPGARLYRSGDLARYLPDGNLEFLGRADHQVKVRGYRIELGEIESALARLEGVEQAVVLAREDVPGDLRLVAYLVARGGKRLLAEALCESLGKSLPDYMLPSAFVVLDRMPLTPNGKVDRRALPAVGRERPELEREFVPPRGALQEYLAGLWRDVLKLDRVGVDDPFFALGGDSLLAARVIQRLQERLGEFIYVVTIFKAPTIAEYARLLREDYPGSVAKTFGGQEAPSVGEPAAVPVNRSVDPDAIEDLRRRIPSHRSVSSSAASAGKNPRAMFILSPPRSGTTLLRVMLAGHADLFSASELNLLLFDTLEERRAAFAGKHRIWLEGTLRVLMDTRGCDAEEAKRLMEEYESLGLTTKEFYRVLQRDIGGRMLVDKSPWYSLDPEALRQAENEFDDPLYIHLVRHPYAMVRSFEAMRMDRLVFLKEHPYSPRELGELIWTISHRNIVSFLATVPRERQVRIRFEDLTSRPRQVMECACEALGLGFDAGLLTPYDGKEQKMTDGLYAESNAMGDHKFHQYRDIERAPGESWKAVEDDDFLSDLTWTVAQSLGYTRPGRSAATGRLERLRHGKEHRRRRRGLRHGQQGGQEIT